MVNDLVLTSMVFLLLFAALLSRSWNFVCMLLVVEGLWVLLYHLLISFVAISNDLSFFVTALLVLTLSAVDLVLCLLCFIIFYHAVNALLPNSTLRSKMHTAYAAGLSTARAFVQKFF